MLLIFTGKTEKPKPNKIMKQFDSPQVKGYMKSNTKNFV